MIGMDVGSAVTRIQSVTVASGVAGGSESQVRSGVGRDAVPVSADVSRSVGVPVAGRVSVGVPTPGGESDRSRHPARASNPVLPSESEES